MLFHILYIFIFFQFFDVQNFAVLESTLEDGRMELKYNHLIELLKYYPYTEGFILFFNSFTGY